MPLGVGEGGGGHLGKPAVGHHHHPVPERDPSLRHKVLIVKEIKTITGFFQVVVSCAT